MGTFVVLMVVIGVVALIIKGMIRDKKNGKSIQCGVSCEHCGGHCSH
ncbi:FeoB-associated Cys-rich membrane protein [Lacrimispora sp.]